MKTNINFHGSDIEKVAKYYNLNESEILNFSGNVNPLGLSKRLESKLINNIHLVTSYPDPDYATLKENIAKYTGANKDYVLLGNGSTELIAHYIDYVAPKKALIIGPTYSEYEKKIRTLHSDVIYFPLKEETDFSIDVREVIRYCQDDVDLVVLCNPNNPTASFIASDDLYPLLDHCKAQDTNVLIDETYMDFVINSKNLSALTLVDTYSNCIVLRGFSKFFAAPGLRLGYGITSDMNCHRSLEKQRHHWSINSLAAFAGKELMIDTEFIDYSKAYINEERSRIAVLLSKEVTIKLYPANANFFFIQLLDPTKSASGAFENLIKQGLMIRDSSSFPFLHGEYIRFCILDKESNDRLINALIKYLHL